MTALCDCYDPEIPVNIVDLGLIYDVRVLPENDQLPADPASADAVSADAVPAALGSADAAPAALGSADAASAAPVSADAAPAGLGSADAASAALGSADAAPAGLGSADPAPADPAGSADAVSADRAAPGDCKVEVDMTLTAQGCPSHVEIGQQVKRRIEQMPGVKEASVNVVWTPPWGPEKMSQAAKDKLGIG